MIAASDLSQTIHMDIFMWKVYKVGISMRRSFHGDNMVNNIRTV